MIFKPTPIPLIDQDEYIIHKLYRERIVQEDNLIHYRMTWMIVSQAFLLALWGVLLQKFLDKTQFVMPIFFYMVSFIGFLFALSSMLSIFAAQGEIDELKRKFLEFYPVSAPPPGSDAARKAIPRQSQRVDILPGVTGSKNFHQLGHLAPRGMPIMMMLVWAILALIVQNHAA